MKPSQKHKTRLKFPAWYPGDIEVSPEDLARLLGDLRYDSLAEYLSALGEKLRRDSEADQGRQRLRLARRLVHAAWFVESAAEKIGEAWEISEPFMEVDE